MDVELSIYGLLVLYAVLALGISFLCSIAEAVLLSVTPSYVATLEEEGKRSAKLIKEMKQNIERPLAAILCLNTVAHTAGAIGVGAEAAKIWGGAGVGIASGVMTLLVLFASEIKGILAYPGQDALALARAGDRACVALCDSCAAAAGVALGTSYAGDRR